METRKGTFYRSLPNNTFDNVIKNPGMIMYLIDDCSLCFSGLGAISAAVN